MLHPIYMLGIGPGDPELVTVKAVRLIKEADIVYVPESNASGRSVAESIIRPYVDKDKLHLSYFPMTNDKAELDRCYTALAEEIAGEQRAGKKVVYVTLGDSMLFSTAQYVSTRLRKLGIEPLFVAGITSYVAAANIAGVSLADKAEDFVVMGIPDNINALKKAYQEHNSVVFMKIHKRLDLLLQFVREVRPSVAVLVQRASLPDEKVYNLLTGEHLPDNAGYLSICLLKKAIA
ncbi:cobalt-factor II C(20)-methyltransferase [Deferribacterales bacterium RsTz2092]|nr:precorrin-2 C(20)-methyltransferase [Deferribacterales bacterium]